jgi:hypothetical protein
MANIFGRQVVVPLTNKSGGGVIAGDVVVVDTANNGAFTTSTAGAHIGGVGIAQETIASNATGRVLIGGYAALVNVNASVTRGNFGKTHTVAKQAADAGSARTLGTFCQFLTGGTTPTAMVFPPDLTAGTLTDHTHAATGSGANGGGSTLTPGTLNIPVATPATTEGQAGWDGTLRGLQAYDSVRAKPITPVGFQVIAYPEGFDALNALSSNATLAAVSAGNGGALAIPINLAAPMYLKQYRMRSNDTASARTAEARLYVSRLDNSATCNFVTGSDATFSFTPGGAASSQSSGVVSGDPLLLAPGTYFLVVRNTSTSQTFTIGTTASSTLGVANMKTITAASVPALGSTLDLVTTWAGGAAIPGLMLWGYKPDHSAAW